MATRLSPKLLGRAAVLLLLARPDGASPSAARDGCFGVTEAFPSVEPRTPSPRCGEATGTLKMKCAVSTVCDSVSTPAETERMATLFGRVARTLALRGSLMYPTPPHAGVGGQRREGPCSSCRLPVGTGAACRARRGLAGRRSLPRHAPLRAPHGPCLHDAARDLEGTSRGGRFPDFVIGIAWSSFLGARGGRPPSRALAATLAACGRRDDR